MENLLTYKFEFLGFNFDEWHFVHDYSGDSNPKSRSTPKTTEFQ